MLLPPQSVRLASWASLRLLPLSLAFIAASPIAGRLAARWLMTIGMSLMGIGLLLFLPVAAVTDFPLIGIALLTVGAIFAEQHDESQVSRRYFSAESLALLDKPKEVQQIEMLAARVSQASRKIQAVPTPR